MLNWKSVSAGTRGLTLYWLLFLCGSVANATNTRSTEAIRQFLEGLDAGDVAAIAGEALNEPGLLSTLYRSRDSEPLWLDEAPLQADVQAMLSEIGVSTAHGFSAERYHYSAIKRLSIADDEANSLALEVLLTDAFLSQAMHRGRGAVHPPNLDADWQVPPAEMDVVGLLAATAQAGGGVREALSALWPANSEYHKLVERRAEIVGSREEFTVRVPAGSLLKPGQSDERVVFLKQRLMGPGDYSSTYDTDLEREVVAFQLAAGLEPDGIVGNNTLEVLNASRVSWIDRIDANLERWRWLPRETPGTYLRVNIAAFTLRAIDEGRTTLAMNVIVGQPYRRTPVFSETIKYIVLNP